MIRCGSSDDVAPSRRTLADTVGSWKTIVSHKRALIAPDLKGQSMMHSAVSTMRALIHFYRMNFVRRTPVWKWLPWFSPTGVLTSKFLQNGSRARAPGAKAGHGQNTCKARGNECWWESARLNCVFFCIDAMRPGAALQQRSLRHHQWHTLLERTSGLLKEARCFW